MYLSVLLHDQSLVSCWFSKLLFVVCGSEFSGVIGVKNEVSPCSLLNPTRVRSASFELMS